MKKFVFLFLALIFVFSACSKDKETNKTQTEKEKTTITEKESKSEEKLKEDEGEKKTKENKGEKKEKISKSNKSKTIDIKKDKIKNTARLLPPEYYAKASKPYEPIEGDLPDGRLYDPLYLEFDSNYIEHNFTLSYDNSTDSVTYYVTLVTELLFNGMDDIACHIYLKSNEALPENFPTIDWYVVEKGEEIFRFATEAAYLAYRDDFMEVGTSEAPALYAGGEDLVQLGSVEEGYMIDGRKRGAMGYCMVYSYPCECGGEIFNRNEFTEEFIWKPGKGLDGYNLKEYLDNGDIFSMSLNPAKEKMKSDNKTKYKPIFLETKSSRKEYTMQYQKTDKLNSTDGITEDKVHVAYEIISHDNTLISAHMYVEEIDLLPYNMPYIDWYLREEDGKIFLYNTEEQLNDYLHTNAPEGDLLGTDDEESTIYAVQEFDGYYLNSFKTRLNDYLLVYGSDQENVNQQEEYYWHKGTGLRNYICSFTEYDDASKSSGSIEKISFLNLDF